LSHSVTASSLVVAFERSRLDRLVVAWTCSSPSNSHTDDNFTDRVFALDNRRIQKALPEGRPGDDLDPPPV
jgi:hypothetical protein